MNRSLYLSSAKIIRFQTFISTYKCLKTFFHLNFNMLSQGQVKEEIKVRVNIKTSYKQI